MKKRHGHDWAVWLKDFILGAQDGIVSNLALVLGVAVATWSDRIVIISGISAALGEAISMAAVAYTSTETAGAYYKSEKKTAVPKEYTSPMFSAWMVGLSNILGSAMALLPFFFLPIEMAIFGAIILCGLTLFLTGVFKAKFTHGNWFRSGTELLTIGFVAAAAGYVIGRILGVAV
ncbi:MAG: VIT1/CCC1 transporter family protein [Candidatus Nanoarchaeia archaeon]|nr:VIT1/CCC1 transporter family protein [Candidatus Nanoarchaeia archaeon]